MTGTALAVAGWWYWRNWRLYGDWLGWEQFLGLVGRRAEPATLIQLWGERVGFVQAYWGLFGGVSVPMPDWIYTIFNAIVVAAALGLAWGLLRAIRRQSIGQVDLALWAILVAWLGLLIAGLARWTSLTQASQGRLLFPGIAAISLFIAAGLRQWWRRLPWVVVAWMGVVAASVPWAVIAPHYAPPPNLAPAEVAAIPSRLGAVFGNEMKLLGYHLQGDRLRPGEVVRVTLYWQSLIAMDRNWSVFVHVVDDSGLIVAQRDRYPGEGSLATTQLQPGQILADRFAIRLPPATYTPAQAHLSVGLYDHLDGTRLAVAGGGDALEFGRLELVPNAGAVPNPLGQNIDNQIELAGYDLTARSLRPGGTLDLTLFWRALAEVRQNYSVSARVRQADGTRWAVQDSWPQQGAAPTSSWRLGQLITDTYRLQLDAATPPGQYELEVVVYDPGSLKPLQLVSADGRRLDDNAIRLSGVLIRP